MSAPEPRAGGLSGERSVSRPRARTRDNGDNYSAGDVPTDRKVTELSPMSLACVRHKYKFDLSLSRPLSLCPARARDIGDRSPDKLAPSVTPSR